MRLRRVAIVLMAVGLVTSAIYATGAFSSLTTQRNANVAVTGDASGYLGLEPAPGPNGAYARQSEDGQLRLTVSEAVGGEEASGEGLNPGSVTTLENVFTITNQGAQSVGLWLSDESDAVTFRVDGQSIEGKDNAIAIGTGDTKPVSIEIDTHNADVNRDLLESVTFNASTDVDGQDVPGPDDGSDGAASDEPEGSDDQVEHSQSTPTPNAKEDDDGFDLLDPGDYAEAGGDFLDAGGDFFNGIGDWTRQQLMEKLSYAVDQPLDALKSLGETAWNFLVGAVFGEVGMPTDKYDFSAKESDSPYYLIGALAGAVFPPSQTATGVRDLAANLVKRKPLAAAFEAVGLVPLLGIPALVQDLYSMGKKWTVHAPKTAAKTVFDPLNDLILKHLPTETKQRITGLFSDDVTKVPALKNTDLTEADIKRLESKDNGYTRERMDTLAKNGFEGTDIRYLAGRGMSPHQANTLKNKGFSVDDIRTFADKGTDPRRAEQLLNEGFSPGDVRHLVDEGEDLNKVSQLRWQEFSPEEIRHYADHGDDAYSEGGATLDQVGKLKHQKVPKDHIRHYVDRGVSLKLVRVLREQGWARLQRCSVLSMDFTDPTNRSRPVYR